MTPASRFASGERLPSSSWQVVAIRVREVMAMIRRHGATPAGVVVSLDRQERGQTELSAIQELQRDHKIQVASIMSLGNLIAYLGQKSTMSLELERLKTYREQYGT